MIFNVRRTRRWMDKLERVAVKPGFHYPSWRPELTARVDGWPVSITRQHGPCWRGRVSTSRDGPSTRVVETGLYWIPSCRRACTCHRQHVDIPVLLRRTTKQSSALSWLTSREGHWWRSLLVAACCECRNPLVLFVVWLCLCGEVAVFETSRFVASL